MESPRKNNDCYFYYYSTCLKGDGCMFRHEPSALGCETVCSFWQQGKCLNQHCNFRHMELRKNRKMIPCYWENQPGGCRKPHCSFQHKNPREPIGGDLEKAKDCENVGAGKPLDRPEWPRRTVLAEGAQFDECVGSSDSDSGRVGPRRVSQSSEASYGSPPVDPLVVNFEEESDNESVPTSTPTKKPQKNVHVKTLEEIRLERIQAESAAFYSYEHDNIQITSNDLRSWIVTRKTYHKPAQDFRILSLEEIRKTKVAGEDGEVESKGRAAQYGGVSSRQVVNSMPFSNFDSENNNGFGSVDSVVGKSVLPIYSVIEESNDSSNDTVKSLPNIGNIRNDVHVENKPSKKRSHSPIIFDTSPKKLPRKDVSKEEQESILAQNKEDDVEMKFVEDVSKTKRTRETDPSVEASQTSKRVRKLVRGVQQCEQPNSRQLRLRRGNVPRLSDSSNVVHVKSELLENSEVSLQVPTYDTVSSTSTNGPSQSQNLLHTSESLSLDSMPSGTHAVFQNECHRETSCSILSPRISASQQSTDDTLVHNLSPKGSADHELSLESSVNCVTSVTDRSNRCSIEAADEELLLEGQDNTMTLEADEDILQDIDDLLKD